MKDRIPRYPGRVTLTPVSGQQNTYDMARADDPIEEGSKLNVANLLPADVCELLGIDPVESELKDALSVLAIGNGKYAYQIKVLTQGGNPVAGAHITGVTAVNGNDLYTDDSGTALGVSTSDSVSLTVTSECWDLVTASQSVQSTGRVTPVTITMGRASTPGKSFTSSTTGALSADVIFLDISACGAGGGGGDGENANAYGNEGGGGGGGHVVNKANVSYTGYKAISITVGSSARGSDGGDTVVIISGSSTITATGGKAGSTATNSSQGVGGSGNGNGGNANRAGVAATDGNMLYPSTQTAGGGGGGGTGDDDITDPLTGGTPKGGDGSLYSPNTSYRQAAKAGGTPGGGGGGGASSTSSEYRYGAAGGRGEAGILWHYEGEE